MFIAPTILTPEGPKELPISFGSAEDAEVLEAWAVDAGHSDTAAAADAVEFAKLGGKRWRYYSRRGEAARSLDDLMQRIAAAPKSEIGFLLVARPEQSTSTSMLAMAWCRRTWCNHLILDFLACHPLAFDKRSGYRGAGTAMLVAMGLISARLGTPLLWGEATEVSAGFYSKNVLGGKPVRDHFFIKLARTAKIAGCRAFFMNAHLYPGSAPATDAFGPAALREAGPAHAGGADAASHHLLPARRAGAHGAAF
jgi:hypothetical protein